MTTPAEWNRTYKEMTDADYVKIPAYNMAVLTTPMASVTSPRNETNIAIITAKLFYSTRYFSSYDIDAGEFTGTHAGIDIKLPLGTPIGAIGGGKVVTVENAGYLGLHVIIEHRLRNGETYYSIYAHLGNAAVNVGDVMIPGQYLGNVGMTGNTSGPHLHLQVDRGAAGEPHSEYHTDTIPSPAEAGEVTANPISFIGKWRNGD